jgi:hypothetical protein
MLIEETDRSTTAIKDKSPHFPIFHEFEGASYVKRYDLLCHKLISEQLYTSAALITSPRITGKTKGTYSSVSDTSSVRSFIASLAGHIAISAARQ